MLKIKKRVKLFELADGAQVIALRGIDTDQEENVTLKIYSEINGGFISFEVPLIAKDKEAADLLFKNNKKLKDFAQGVYLSQRKQFQDFSPELKKV